MLRAVLPSIRGKLVLGPHEARGGQVPRTRRGFWLTSEDGCSVHLDRQHGWWAAFGKEQEAEGTWDP